MEEKENKMTLPEYLRSIKYLVRESDGNGNGKAKEEEDDG